MDPKMPKLPAYVFRRQNGSYRYKRNVPKKLRPLIGKDTLYRQLGESYSEAMNALPKVHLEMQILTKLLPTFPIPVVPLQILDFVLSVLDISLFVFWATGA